MHPKFALVTLGSLALAASALAADTEAFYKTRGYSLTTLSDAVSGLQTAGKGLYVGGNLSVGSVQSGTTYGIATTTSSVVPSTSASVFVGGNLNVVKGSLTATSGDVAVKGSITQAPGTSINVASGETVTTGSSLFDPASVSGYYNTLSQAYNGMANTGTITNNGGALRITLNPGVNVVRISATTLNNAWQLAITGTATSSLIVNVQGTAVASFDDLAVSVAGGMKPTSTLLNFYQATSIRITGGGKYNLLAPKATVTFPSGTINGNVVVNKLAAEGGVGGEILPFYQSGTGGGYRESTVYNPTPPVPEPASMLALGLGGAALLRRRKRA